MSDATHCVFCKIVQGVMPAVKIYEDDSTLAFMDIQPIGSGHTLVIPKSHAADLFTITAIDLNAVTGITQSIARAIHKALTPDGIRIVQTNGAAAGQTVFHYHVHLIPMQEGQRFVTHGRARANPEALKALAAKIQEALETEKAAG